MLFTGWKVRIGKDCALCLKYSRSRAQFFPIRSFQPVNNIHNCSNNDQLHYIRSIPILNFFSSWCRNLYLQARIILMNTEININQMRHFSKCYSNEVSFQCFSTNQHWLRPQKGIGWLLSRVQLAVEKLPRFVMDSWCASKQMAKLQYPKLWKSCKSLTWFNTSNWKVCSWKEVAFFFGYYFSLPHFSSRYFAIQRTWKCSLY